LAGLLRRVIRIRAEDSPNVRLALAEIAAGKEPSHETLVPGVLSYADFLIRLKTWDVVRQTIGLFAEFYKGAQLLMFPPDWLNLCHRESLRARCLAAPADGIGIDPAEGGDSTAMAALNRWGIKDLVSRKTPNTDDIVREALAFMRRHGVPPERVCFDRGGGGQQHADRMRAMRTGEWPQGCHVRTVAFGEPLSLDPKRGLRRIEERMEVKEEKYAYKDRRTEMYWDLRTQVDPSLNPEGFYIAPGLMGNAENRESELRHQIAVLPVLLDEHGRYWMLPKSRKSGDEEKKKQKTWKELISHSPDEADAVVLALHARLHVKKRVTAGAL